MNLTDRINNPDRPYRPSMTLHDADEVVGYIPPRWLGNEPHPPIEPTVTDWPEVREILAGFATLLLFCVAFWIWMAIAVASQVAPNV